MSDYEDGPKNILNRWWFWTFIAFPGAVLSVFLGSLLAHFTVGRIDGKFQHRIDTVRVVDHPAERENPEGTKASDQNTGKENIKKESEDNNQHKTDTKNEEGSTH
jgi:hypothetical protein